MWGVLGLYIYPIQRIGGPSGTPHPQVTAVTATAAAATVAATAGLVHAWVLQ